MTSSTASTLPFFAYLDLVPLILMGLNCILVMIGQILRLPTKLIFTPVTLIFILAWLASFMGPFESDTFFHGFTLDSIDRLAFLILIPAVFGVCLMVLKEHEPQKRHTSLLLIMISFLGAMVVMGSQNWMVFFVGTQCMSIPVYGLLAFNSDNKIAITAATKYLVLSVVAIAFLLFGIVLLYSFFGSMDLEFEAEQPMFSKIVLLGVAFVFVGIGFKTSLVPFHIWAPDVYQGASLFVTTYLVVIVKASIIVFLLRNLSYFIEIDSLIPIVLSMMALLSMWLGNGLMMKENNFLRFLGFLSIGHLGFLMVPLLSNSFLGLLAIFIDLIAFSFAIFLVTVSMKLSCKAKPINALALSDLEGLFFRNKNLACTLTISFASLVGIPLTAGFIGKYAMVSAGMETDGWWLTIQMLLSSLFAIIAFTKIVFLMAKERKDQASICIEVKKREYILLAGAMVLLAFGVFPNLWVNWVTQNAQEQVSSSFLVSRR